MSPPRAIPEALCSQGRGLVECSFLREMAELRISIGFRVGYICFSVVGFYGAGSFREPSEQIIYLDFRVG